MTQMTSSRPYLIRAMYQWITDNGLTPHLLIDAEQDDVIVPVEHIQNGKIILNIAPMAISALEIGDGEVTFSARFSGQSMGIYVPISSVFAIYAKENGQGMMFNDDDSELSTDGDDDLSGRTGTAGSGAGNSEKSSSKANKPNLRVIK